LSDIEVQFSIIQPGAVAGKAEKMKRLGLLLVMVLCLGSAAHAAPQIFYRLITLQPLPGYTISCAMAVNNHNEVVGYSDSIAGRRPTYWNPGNNYAPQDIGTFGGSFGQALGINDGSYVVGDSSTPGGTPRAFFWDPTTAMLRQLYPDNQGDAKAINIHGLAAGSFGNTHACLFQLNTPPDDLSAGYTNWANGLNDSALVVGAETSNRTDFHTHAVIWDNRTWQDLTPGATHNSAAFAVNNNSEVTGFYYSPTGSNNRAFIYDKFKGLREIGTLGGATSYGYGINRKGEVVGRADISSGTSRAFIWREGQGISNLNSLIKLGVVFEALAANDINDSGSIVGLGRDFKFDNKAFLLLPIRSISSVLSLLLLY
jgi:probable HAF family extracellular repeat protein